MASHRRTPMFRPFREFDVFPAVPGQRRPPERVVMSMWLPFASWYSPDHYEHFILMFPPGCLPDPTTLVS